LNKELLTLRELYQFDNLELLARQVVEGFIIGLHKSPFHGFSVEFAEHRLYNSGDTIRNIDWKVFARTDRLYVKKYEEETNLRCQMIVDASSSMFYPYEEKGKRPVVNKVRFASVAAAALMYMLRKQRDAVGLSIFSDEVEVHTRTRSTSVHHKLLYSYLENLINENREHKKTAAAQCLHQIAENVHKRSLVVLFSDMMDNVEAADELFSALQHLKYNKHEVLLFHVVDQKHELEFEFENRPYIFEDLETGEKVKLQSNQVKDYYTEKMATYKKQLELKCGQFEIDFIEADVNKDFSQVLLPYLVKRSRLY